MLAALALLLTATAVTFAANPLMDTWKLNEAKSKFAPGSTKNTTVTYTEAEGDMIKLTVEGVDKDGHDHRGERREVARGHAHREGCEREEVHQQDLL
jgi:hypothetical protein